MINFDLNTKYNIDFFTTIVDKQYKVYNYNPTTNTLTKEEYELYIKNYISH